MPQGHKVWGDAALGARGEAGRDRLPWAFNRLVGLWTRPGPLTGREPHA